jgi:hypothetical protein
MLHFVRRKRNMFCQDEICPSKPTMTNDNAEPAVGVVVLTIDRI